MTETASTYEVVIARYGTRETTRSEVYLNYPLYHEPDGPIGMDYFVWVIRNAERTVLVDTGFSTAGGAARTRTMLIHPTEIWAALGIDPATAPPIVLTHAHYDHTGNLDHFPGSRIIVAASELEFWDGVHAQRTLFHHSVEDEDLAVLRAARDEGRVEAFAGSCAVAPGIDVIEVGGHTPGQSIVLVQTSDGPVLLASDAIHYYEELDRDMLFTSVADLTQMYGGFDTVKAMLADGRARHLVSGHDPATLQRFEALQGPLAPHAARIGAVA